MGCKTSKETSTRDAVRAVHARNAPGQRVIICFGAAGGIGKNAVLALAKEELATKFSASDTFKFLLIDKNGEGLRDVHRTLEAQTDGPTIVCESLDWDLLENTAEKLNTLAHKTSTHTVHSVIFAQSETPFLDDVQDADRAKVAAATMFALYAGFLGSVLTHADLAPMLKRARILVLCLNLADDFVAASGDKAAQAAKFRKFVASSSGATSLTEVGANIQLNAKAGAADLLNTHRFTFQAVRAIAYVADHIGFEVMVLHPGVYFTSTETQRGLFALLENTTYPGVEKDLQELMTKPKFTNGDSGESAGKLLASIIVSPQWYGKDLAGLYFGSLGAQPGVWASILSMGERKLATFFARVCFGKEIDVALFEQKGTRHIPECLRGHY